MLKDVFYLFLRILSFMFSNFYIVTWEMATAQNVLRVHNPCLSINILQHLLQGLFVYPLLDCLNSVANRFQS